MKLPCLKYCLVLFLCCSFTPVQIATPEYQLKAAFLYNFTQFIEWPPEKFASPTSPLVIGILGKDPFGKHLREIASGETFGRHPLVVRHFKTGDDFSNCHILYMNLPDAEIRSALQRLQGKGVLTTGEAPAFARMGGMIRLYKKNEKIRMQINLNAAKKEKLVISSKLLKLAEIVESE